MNPFLLVAPMVFVERVERTFGARFVYGLRAGYLSGAPAAAACSEKALISLPRPAAHMDTNSNVNFFIATSWFRSQSLGYRSFILRTFRLMDSILGGRQTSCGPILDDLINNYRSRPKGGYVESATDPDA